MTRDTDRPRRGTDKPSGPKTGTARPRASQGGDKPRFGDRAPRDTGKGFTKSFGDKPARGAKPDRSKREAGPAARPASGEAVATIVQTERQRIAKLMARVGLCSRRDAEAWIVDGRVTLNGETLTSPAQDVGSDDTILVDGIPLPAAEKTRLFLFHKPRGLVTSDHDPEGRETVASYLSENWPDGPRVVTIGRLDINTEGLLLLTNDGGLARVLELPATGWVRRYRVRAKGETDQGILDSLRAGIVVDGVDYAGIEAKLDRIQGANCWLTMGLREGKNREIKRVLEHLGLEVNRLIRLSYGPFQLLDLPEGKVEEVKTRILRDQLGETLAAEAGVDFADSEAPIVAAPVPTKSDSKVSRRSEGAKPARRDSDTTSRRDSARTDGHVARPRRRDGSEEEVQPIRERPVAGARRHVSTLRSEVASDQRKGPRKRIERTDTRDSNDRTVKVERLVTQRGTESEMPRARRGAGRLAPRDGEDTRKPSRSHASPSAMAKRERISKSGGDAPRDRAPSARRYGERDEASAGGAKVRSVRPSQDEARPFRERKTGGESRGKYDATRGNERAGDQKPWREARSSESDRPKTGHSGSSTRDAPRSARADGFKESPRGGERASGVKRASAGAKQASAGAKPFQRDTGDRPPRATRPARDDSKASRPARAERSPAKGGRTVTSRPIGSRPDKPRSPNPRTPNPRAPNSRTPKR